MIVSLMDSGSLFVFNSYNDEEFIKDFKHEMKKAKRLAICTSRGSFLMDPPYRVFKQEDDTHKDPFTRYQK